MRTMTATHASRGFAEVLDAVQDGATITITRAGRPVAEIRPVHSATGRALSDALDSTGVSLDGDLDRDIAATRDLLTGEDPWADA